MAGLLPMPTDEEAASGVLAPPQAPAMPMQAPQGGGVLGGLRNAVGGVLGLPGRYVGAIGSALADAPDAIAAMRTERDTRAVSSQLALQQAIAIYKQVLSIEDPQRRMAALANLPEYGKALAQNYGPNTAKGGETIQYGQGGPTFTAPLLGMTKDGQGYTQTPDATTASGALPTIQSAPAGTTVGPIAPAGPAAPNAPGLGGAATPGPAPAPTASPSGAGIDPQGFFKAFVLRHEGGLNPADMNGSPTKYGINQAAHPEVNVRDLTPDQAGQIFQKDYWDKSGAANLPASLAAVHADTYFINPSRANAFLQQSGGDWQKYMQLRQDWMGHMVANNPAAAKYAHAWSQRNSDLAKVAQGLSGAPASGGAPTGAPAAQGLPTSIQGKTTTHVSPQEAASLGLAPGVWERDPTGHLVQTSKPTDDDLARVASLGATVTQLRALTQEQQAFLAHNKSYGTGPHLSNPEVHGVPLNAWTELQTHTNPDAQAMEASAGHQLFQVKPENAGARILQSELPFWEIQTQSLAKTGDVNASILHDNAHKLAQAQAQQSFFQTWLYRKGNLNGADGAFNRWWSQSKYAAPPTPQGQAAQPAQAAQAGLPHLNAEQAARAAPGTRFIGIDGLTYERH